MSPEHSDLARQAADPATDWHTLHWIAENFPELRPAVAENPSTYPALVEALADLGDPQIDAALDRREDSGRPTGTPLHHGAAAEAAEWPADPSADRPEARETHEPADPETDRIDTVPAPGTTPGALPGAASGAASRSSARARRTTRMPPPTWDAIITPQHARREGTDAEPRAAAPRPRASGPPSAPAPVLAPRSQYHRTRRRVGIVLLAVVLPLVVLGAIAALLLNILGGYGPQWADFSGGSTSEDQSEDDQAEEPGEEPDQNGAAEDPPPADQAREDMQDLASSSTCSSAEDAEVFTSFADASSSGGAWEQDDDGELVESTLLDLDEECGQAHAAAIYLQLSTNDEDEALTGALDDMGTDWVSPTHPAPAGEELTTFASPDGNVVCEFDDAVRCRVLDQSFPLPEECDSDTTMAIYADQEPAPDCDNPVPDEGQETLGYGQTAANEFFACTSFQSQMSCWNQLSGEGFNLQSDRGTTY